MVIRTPSIFSLVHDFFIKRHLAKSSPLNPNLPLFISLWSFNPLTIFTSNNIHRLASPHRFLNQHSFFSQTVNSCIKKKGTPYDPFTIPCIKISGFIFLIRCNTFFLGLSTMTVSSSKFLNL
uniref:Uncharacterized protein n=1 Tax=Helianthus annuus TaxID=4232 RepID=A0A251SF06_HELAN